MHEYFVHLLPPSTVGMMSAAASVGMIGLWDVETGLAEIDKYTYAPEDQIKVVCTNFLEFYVYFHFYPAPYLYLFICFIFALLYFEIFFFFLFGFC